MQIVIDIPEETYEYWKEHKHEYVLAEAIANGTPLPKGHGDLIDRDELQNVCANNQVDIMNDGDKNTLIIVDTDDNAWHDLLSEKYAPTVIPADNEVN